MRAQAVFIILVILFSIISLSLIWGVILFERLHLVTEGSEAVKAFYAADSALDCKLYQIYINSSETCPPSMSNNTQAQVTVLSGSSGQKIVRAKGWTIDTQIYRHIETNF